MARKDKEQDKKIKREYSRKYYSVPENKIRHAISVRKWYLKNREKMRQYAKVYWSLPENKEKGRRAWFKRAYGISVEEYEALVFIQKGSCAICKRPCKTNKALSVDHDHKTGKIRGLLCQACNSALGFMEDSIDNIENMIKYLKKFISHD